MFFLSFFPFYFYLVLFQTEFVLSKDLLVCVLFLRNCFIFQLILPYCLHFLIVCYFIHSFSLVLYFNHFPYSVFTCSIFTTIFLLFLIISSLLFLRSFSLIIFNRFFLQFLKFLPFFIDILFYTHFYPE